MKKYLLSGIFAAVLVVGCATNPVTGKKNLNFVSNSELFPSSFQQYSQFISENKVITGTADAKLVEAVGFKIKKAAEKYLTYLGQAQYLTDYRWEYKLVDNKEVNAWCMPGGKVAVYAGILPVTQTDAGLATVMGHEIAHAIAGHSAERMSQEMVAQGVGAAAGVALSKNPKTQSELFKFSRI